MSRSGERGIVLGCWLGLILVVAMLAGAAFIADRALAAPVLGAPPAGPSHGVSEGAIALTLGEEMASQLVAGPQGVVVLSEQDLTVLAAANNPHPDEYRDIEVRVRDGLVVASGQTSEGPFTPTVVAHISLSLRPGPRGPVIAAQIPELDVGLLTLPGFAGAGLVAQIDSALSLDRLFAIAPRLSPLRADIECVAVVSDGVAIGVHDPDVPAIPGSCG